jgi:DNA-binding PucR family transcriptional regulator
MSEQPEAAHRLVERELGKLAEPDPALDVVRETLSHYLRNGSNMVLTASELLVHRNTVRYRLKRVSDVIGWDATGPREALILQTALILGSIGTDSTRRRLPTLRRGGA